MVTQGPALPLVCPRPGKPEQSRAEQRRASAAQSKAPTAGERQCQQSGRTGDGLLHSFLIEAAAETTRHIPARTGAHRSALNLTAPGLAGGGAQHRRTPLWRWRWPSHTQNPRLPSLPLPHFHVRIARPRQRPTALSCRTPKPAPAAPLSYPPSLPNLLRPSQDSATCPAPPRLPISTSIPRLHHAAHAHANRHECLACLA